MWSKKFFGTFKLLPEIHYMIFSNIPIIDSTHSKMDSVSIGYRMWTKFPKVEKEVNHSTSLDYTKFHSEVRSFMWYLEEGIMVCSNAKLLGSCICIMITKDALRELFSSWSRNSLNYLCTQGMEALHVWRHYMYGVHFEMFSDHKTLKYLFY